MSEPWRHTSPTRLRFLAENHRSITPERLARALSDAAAEIARLRVERTKLCGILKLLVGRLLHERPDVSRSWIELDMAREILAEMRR